MVAWYEEGATFRQFAGVARDRPDLVHLATDRYLRLARQMGATTIWPTVLVYGEPLYPSTYNLAFGEQRSDVLAGFLLGAKRYGLKVSPEFHPRADELLWAPRDPVAFARRLLTSGTRQPNLLARDGSVRRPPYYNALDPDVRRWYRQVIGDLAMRYRESSTFVGITLRVSEWANPAFNNLVSLDWGYDAATVRRFLGDTAVVPPTAFDLQSDTPDAAVARHTFLTGVPREAWVDWRCRQLRDVLADIVATVRAARPDLVVSLHFSAMTRDRDPALDRQRLRELGLDPWLLRDLPGLELVEGRLAYGSKQLDPVERLAMRTAAGASGAFAAFVPAGQRPRTLITMQYMGVPFPLFMHNEQIGWPSTKREPWITSASEPPGRLKLARYAEMVGLHDVHSVGDGGNGYVFVDDGLRTFTKEFATLPRVPFERVDIRADSVVLWRHDRYFYVVNVSAKTASRVVRAANVDSVEALGSGVTIPLSDGGFPLTFQAYELRSFRADRAPSALNLEVPNAPR
ncbi:hypothetical protein ABB55_06320 [Prosthecomicrobium hirschii]|uniref:Glycoside hydrolase family 42 N-terminal domain-containing protein n=1 Tax=Prosthecodimorpha hirschii TaxID=665126 RepID=A0A0N8GEL9_9HYPH|nr:hypothetical protein [Prosthecomicrobium hirschii]KPL51889.1 hypothetical protein ABB55_06320 [Prosthecomicrobium hirschii]